MTSGRAVAGPGGARRADGPEAAPILRVSNVETAYFGRLTVLRGVSLEVPAGRVVTLLGSNGAGKSTLLRTIMGFIPDQPEKGTIEVIGRRVNGWDPEDIAGLGVAYIPEGRGIFPELTVEENLRLGAYRRRDRRVTDDIEALEAQFPILRARRAQLAGTLSGGEQQMLAVARALLSNPRLLLLDEPSLGLAPRIVGEMFQIIRNIHAAGTAILLVEQNARQALGVADYGYVLETWRIVLEGTCEHLQADANVQELYLGMAQEASVKGFRRYKMRRRWS